MKRVTLVAACVLLISSAAVAQDNLSDFGPVGGEGPAETQTAAAPDGPLTFYGDRPSFDAANPGLPIEDWEDFIIGAGGVAGCDAPANSTTSCPGVYSAGDILPGLELVDDVGPDPGGLVALGVGFNGNASIQFGSNTFVDALVLNFSPAVGAAGMEIACHFSAGTVDVVMNDSGGTLIGSTTSACSNAGTFFGVDSSVAIGSIRIFEQGGAQAELIDNIAFGGPAVPVTLQSIEVD